MNFPAQVQVTLLDQKCVDYEMYSREWLDLDLLSDGGVRLRDAVRSGATDMLVKRPKEPGDVYAQRVARFTSQPILPNVISWYTAKLFEQDPQITGLPTGSEFWDQFQEDCDRSGTTLKNFAADVFETAFAFSSAYVLTDLPTNDGIVPQSLADQVKYGLLNPYLTLFTPLSVLNYRTDRYGNLDMIVLKTENFTTDFLGKPETVYEWRYFDRKQFAVYRATKKTEGNAILNLDLPNDSQADLVASGVHSLADFNRVPVRRIALRKPMRLARRAYLQLLDHLNQDNTYGWALFNANLAMLAFFGANLGQPTISEIGYFDLPQDARVEWLEPKGVTFDAAQKRLDSLRQEIYRSFHLQAQGRDSSATAAASSGYSKELEMAPAHDMLDGFGELIRSALAGILIDVADALGIDSTQINVGWPRYDSVVAQKEIELAGELQTVGIPSDTLTKIMYERAAMAYMQDETKERQDAVKAEIEAAPTQSEQMAAQRDAQVLQFQQALTKANDKAFAHSDVVAGNASLAA